MPNIVFPHNLAVGVSPSTAIITLEVTFDNTPASSTVTTAKVKHNKKGVFMYHKDDATIDDYSVFMPLFKTLYGTDGAGKRRNYRATIALNAGGHDVIHSQILNYDQIKEIYDEQHSISNHGYNHGGTDIYREVKEAEIRIWDQMKTRGRQVRTRCTVTPTNDEGYIESPFSMGYKCFAGSFGFPYTSRDGNLESDIKYATTSINDLNKNKMILARDYVGNDFIDLAQSKLWFDAVANNTTMATPLAASIISHNISTVDAIARYNDFWSYVMNHPNNNDTILMESQQDFMEYYETIDNTIITSNLVGNKLTVTLNQSAISGNNYRRDMSLLITGGSIKHIQVTNVDGSTVNRTTGLINLYKTNKNINDPNLDPVPPRITSFVRDGLTLTVNFSKEVTGSTGFEIIGNTISSVTGTGAVRVITCTTLVLTGDIFYYRIQNGNIVDVNNATLKLCTYTKHPII